MQCTVVRKKTWEDTQIPFAFCWIHALIVAVGFVIFVGKYFSWHVCVWCEPDSASWKPITFSTLNGKISFPMTPKERTNNGRWTVNSYKITSLFHCFLPSERLCGKLTKSGRPRLATMMPVGIYNCHVDGPQTMQAKTKIETSWNGKGHWLAKLEVQMRSLYVIRNDVSGVPCLTLWLSSEQIALPIPDTTVNISTIGKHFPTETFSWCTKSRKFVENQLRVFVDLSWCTSL